MMKRSRYQLPSATTALAPGTGITCTPSSTARRTIADLLADNHYGAATEYLHQRGVGLYAGQLLAASSISPLRGSTTAGPIAFCRPLGVQRITE